MTTTPRHKRTLRRPVSRNAWWVLVDTVKVVCRVLRGLVATTVLLALVVGLPWALWQYIGWPLPDHVPRWPEIQGVLLGPMTATFLLDFLACLCWIVWAAFTVDVLRCTKDLVRSGINGARLPDFSTASPLHALSGVLIGAILVAVLGNRPAPAPTTSLSTVLTTNSTVVATAAAWGQSSPGNTVAVHHVSAAGRMSATSDPTAEVAIASPRPESVVVRAPHNGVHDSLWRIAHRTLGSGSRWPEIFELNKGKSQPYGHTLTKPSLIFPGEELAIPQGTHTAAPPPQRPADESVPALPTTPPPPSPQPPTSIPPTAPPPAAPDTSTAPTATSEPGVHWGTELFVSLGLAGAISAALLTVRRRHRSRYRPGSGDRDDLPVAPVVYQLRLAHLRTEDQDDHEHSQHRPLPPKPPHVVGAPAPHVAALAPELGVREGREVALELATARGLGLLGAGATAAARALLINALTAYADAGKAPRRPIRPVVVVPAEDVTALLGQGMTRQNLPSAVCVAGNLDEALDTVEAETLVRASASQEADLWPPVMLVTRPPVQHQRLQAVLDNGAPFGVTGLMLGQWQPGVTAFVRDDGTVSATSPGLGEGLRGTRMFRIGDEDAAELLLLLRQAEPDPASEGGGTATERSKAIDLEVTAAAATPPDAALEILSPGRRRAGVGKPCASLPNPTSVRAAASRSNDGDHHANEVVDELAGTEPAQTSPADLAQNTAIRITVLGGLRVLWCPQASTVSSDWQEITGALQPRTKELLVLLALHPDGTTRDALVSAVWGQDPPTRPTNALHTALSRLRAAVASATDDAVPDIVLVSNGRYQLDPAQVDVDYWHFAHAVAARRTAPTDQDRIAAYRLVVDSYCGALAEGMSAEWLEPIREAVRRDAIDAVAALARALVDRDPQQTLDLLEVARAFDPHNELLYRDIMRLQERLGQPDAILRTLNLLTTRLAEIDAKPTTAARELAARLGQRHDDAIGPTSAPPKRTFAVTVRPVDASSAIKAG